MKKNIARIVGATANKNFNRFESMLLSTVVQRAISSHRLKQQWNTSTYGDRVTSVISRLGV